MDRRLFPIAFRDLDVGTSAWLIAAALASAFLCSPLVLAFLFTLILAVETAASVCLPAPVAATPRPPATRRLALRGPPAR
jgi:hypothetical protein